MSLRRLATRITFTAAASALVVVTAVAPSADAGPSLRHRDGTFEPVPDWGPSTGTPPPAVDHLGWCDDTELFVEDPKLAGDDTIHGDDHPNLIFGTDTKGDNIYGHGGGDCVWGLGMGDTLRGDAGNDYLFGGEGDDDLDGGDDRDRLAAGAGDDTLRGADGPDGLLGGSGDDVLYGGNGTDTLIGGPGQDRIYSGAGADRIDARDGDVDYVHCGSGAADTVKADSFDLIDPTC